MRKITKFLTLTLALAMVISLAAGCGNSADDSLADNTGTQDGTAAVSKDAGTGSGDGVQADLTKENTLPLTEEKITLTAWSSVAPFFFQTAESFDDNAYVQEYERLTNVHVKYTIVDGTNATTAFGTMIASLDLPDMISNVESRYSGGLAAALDNDIIVDLSDIAAEYAPNYLNVINSDEQHKKFAYDDDGRMGALLMFYATDEPGRLGPIIREDWLDALNLEVPQTYDDYYGVLTAFKAEYGATLWVTKSGTPAYSLLTNGYDVDMYVGENSMFQPWYQVDGTVKYGPLEKDNAVAYLSMMNQWYSEGLLYPDFLSGTSMFTADTGVVLNGEVGIFYQQRTLLSSIYNLTDDPEFKVTPIQDATREEGKETYLRYTSGINDGMGYSVSTECEDTVLAVKWLDYLYSEEGVRLTNYGVQGLSWDYTAAGEPELTELMYKNPDGLTYDQACLLYTTGSGFYRGLCNWRQETVFFTESEMKSVELWSAGTSWRIPAASKMTADETSEYTDIYADIMTFASTAITEFIIGDRAISDYDVFIGQLQSMGIDSCIALKQAAYDRYLAR